MASDSVALDAQPVADWPVTLIEPRRRWFHVDLPELLRYRELLGLLVWRDIAVRYKQSVGGVLWAVIHPVATTLIFTVIFGLVLGVSSGGAPYPLFAFCALLPWNYFARALTGSSQSLVRAGNLINKVYFPRLILPLTDLLVALVDFAIALVILVGLMIGFGMVPTWRIALLPGFIVLAMATALGVGLWLTALGAKYRDVNQITPFLVQAWMWASPVVYATSAIPGPWRALYALNPMVGVIEGFRWMFLTQPAPIGGAFGGFCVWSPPAQPAPDLLMMAASVGVVIVLLVTGLAFFSRIERTLADVI